MGPACRGAIWTTIPENPTCHVYRLCSVTQRDAAGSQYVKSDPGRAPTRQSACSASTCARATGSLARTRSHSPARVGKKWTLLCVLTPASLPQQIKTCLSLSGCLSPADPIHQHYKGAQAASRSAQFPPAVMKYQNRSERGHPHTCKEMI